MQRKTKQPTPKGKKGGKSQKEFYTHIGNVKNVKGNTSMRKRK